MSTVINSNVTNNLKLNTTNVTPANQGDVTSSSSQGVNDVETTVVIGLSPKNGTEERKENPNPANLQNSSSAEKNDQIAPVEMEEKKEKKEEDKKEKGLSNIKPSTSWKKQFDCESFLSEEYCHGKNDVRGQFVFKYRFNQSKKRYLFVVNYHWDFFSTTTFIRNTLYKRINELFPIDFDVLCMGPIFDGKNKVVNHRLRIGGEYSFYSVVRAYQFLRGYYDYDGYFFINDDAFVDPIRLKEYDFTRSFHEPTRQYQWGQYWSWNVLKNELKVGYPQAFRTAIDEVRSIPELEGRCNLSDEINHRRGLQDFFFVVASDMPMFIKLADVFYKHRAFLEMAAPTINWCLSHQPIITCNHHNWPNVTTCAHLHPIKFGHPTLQTIAMLHINQVDTKRVVPMSWFSVC